MRASRRRLRACAAVGLLVGVTSTPDASAQAPTFEEPPAQGLFRLGPVQMYPSLIIQDAGIDDNVLNTSTGSRDFTFTAGPRLQSAVRVGAVRVLGTGSAGFVYFHTFKNQQSVSSLVGLRVDTMSGRIRPFAQAQHARVRERSDIDVLQRARVTRPDLLGGIDVHLTPITALTGWVQRSDVAYDDRETFLDVPLATELNRRTETAAGGVRYSLTSLTTVVVAGEWKQHRFDRSPLRNANSFRLAPTVSIATGTPLTGQVGAGFQSFVPTDRSLSRLRGVVVNATVAYTLLEETTFEALADRDVDFSFDVTQPYYWRMRARLAVSHHLVGPLDLIAFGDRRQVDRRGIIGQVSVANTDRVFDAGAGVGVRVAEGLQLRVVYDQMRHRASEPGRSFERRRVLASVEVRPR